MTEAQISEVPEYDEATDLEFASLRSDPIPDGKLAQVDTQPQTFLQRVRNLNKKEVACMAVGTAIGVTLGWFSVDLINQAGTNPLINSDSLVAWKSVGAFIGGSFGI